jgi:coenzyme F420-0:L-glutamate ligase
VSERFDVVGFVRRELEDVLAEGDVIVVSSKFLAISEGRVVKISSVKATPEARDLARRYGMDERFCELVLRESDEVIGGVPGFLLAMCDGLLTPNAGIDKSNILHGMAVLYPRRPQALANTIRESIKFAMGVSVAVVICDSRLAPTRRGTTGVALASAGLEAIRDFRGKTDLFGNVLKVTSQAIADDVSSAAELLMGESDEATPIVVVRGLNEDLIQNTVYHPERFSISAEECVYLRSLGRGQVQHRLLASHGQR